MPRKKSAAKTLAKWFLILLVGAAGGFLLNYLILPNLAQTQYFQRWQFFRNLNQRTTIINQTQQTTITENMAWQKITDQITRNLIAIEALGTKNVVLNQASGLTITNDGLVLAPSKIIAKDKHYNVNYNGENIPAEIFFNPSQSDLAIFKIQKNNLTVLPLADDEKIKLSQPVLLAGLEQDDQKNWLPFVNQGIIRSFNRDNILTSIQEAGHQANGSVLINLSNEIVGINLVTDKKELVTLPATKITTLLEQALKNKNP